jgi:hypothetical protein
MNFFTNSDLTCRFCRYYDPVGRRGGTCQKLQASVEATWSACTLAIPAFNRDWESPTEIANSLPAQINAAAQVEQYEELYEQVCEQMYEQIAEETLSESSHLAFARLKEFRRYD